MSGTVVDFESYRSALKEKRAPRIADRPPDSPFGSRRRELSDRQLAHRRRMLKHLQSAPASRSA